MASKLTEDEQQQLCRLFEKSDLPWTEVKREFYRLYLLNRLRQADFNFAAFARSLRRERGGLYRQFRELGMSTEKKQ